MKICNFSLVNTITQQILIALGPNLSHGCISGVSWLSLKMDELDLYVEVIGLISKLNLFNYKHNKHVTQSILGGVTQGCPYPISQIFYPPISHIPDFLPPNIPYPRFFTPQYPISQISQSIDHIPDFARIECVCIHSFDIQLVRMDPILLDIFIIAVNIHVHGHLELHFNNVYHSNMYMGSH